MSRIKDLIFLKNKEEETPSPTKSGASFPKSEFPKSETSKEPETSGFSFQTSTTPVTAPVTTPTPVTSDVVSKEITDSIRQMYQQGFDALNQSGYDFYEFYKAIQQAGAETPQMYVMAFAMAQAMDSSLTKERLIQSADFYLQKILEAHQNFATQGHGKLQAVESQKHNERRSLEGELQNLQEQLNALQIQINDRKQKLGQIDSKYITVISETQGKINANNSIKDEFVSTLTKIKNGVANNLK